MSLTPSQLLQIATGLQDSTQPSATTAPATPVISKGKPDAAKMQELVDLIKSSPDLKERVSALEEIEELVESLDNANDLEPLGLWLPLIAFTSDSQSEIRFHAAWVLGTAVQNNEKSQHSFYKHGGIDAVTVLLNDGDVNVISKSLYCLSGLLNHFPDALSKFIELDGFKKLASVLSLGDLNCCRKVLFLLSSLLTNEDNHMTHTAALNVGLGTMVVSLMQFQDLDIVEKAITVLEVWEGAYPGTVGGFFGPSQWELHGAIKDDGDLQSRLLKLKGSFYKNFKGDYEYLD